MSGSSFTTHSSLRTTVMWWCALSITATLVVSGAAQNSELNEFKEVFMWNKLDFKWPDESAKLRALSDARFQPVNCALSGITPWRDRLFVTVPRMLPGVPATLASLPASPQPNNVSPLLEPFPSWDMQAIGNCTALQYVQDVEVDPSGRLWVPDSGRVNTLSGTPDTRCPPKIVMIDADTGRTLTTVQFGPSVLSTDSLLADIVVGDNDVAYVSDASMSDPGIVVVNSLDGRSWKVRDSRSMRAENVFVQVGQRRTELRQNVFGLALSPKSRNMPGPRRLYYAPLSSYELYSLPVDALASPGLSVSSLVKSHGRMSSPAQAFAMDWHANLYAGLLEQSAVAVWNSAQQSPISSARLVTQDAERLQWLASFGFDGDRNLWLVSNRLQNFLAGTVNQNTPNYRIIRAFVDSKSYQYTDDAWNPPASSPYPVPGGTPTTPSPGPTTTHSAAATHKVAALLLAVLSLVNYAL